MLEPRRPGATLAWRTLCGAAAGLAVLASSIISTPRAEAQAVPQTCYTTPAGGFYCGGGNQFTGEGSVDGATAVGAQAWANNSRSTAVGYYSLAFGRYSSVFGAGASAGGDWSSAFGVDSRADAESSVAIGYRSRATAANSVSFGDATLKRRLMNLAQGDLNATSSDAVTGAQLFATRQALANLLGGGAAVDAAGVLTAPGFTIRGANYATVGAAFAAVDTALAATGGPTGAPEIASNNVLGRPAAAATGDDSLAVGWGAQGIGARSVVLGSGGRAAGEGSLALGSDSQASGRFTAALGNGALAGGLGAIALGDSSSALADNALALGRYSGVGVGLEGAVALGYQSIASEAYTVSIGNSVLKRRLVNLADGTLVAGSTDAVTGGQLFATHQRLDSLDGRIAGAEGDISVLQGRIATGAIGLVQQDAATQIVTVAGAQGGDVVDISGAAGRRRIQGVAEGEISADSTEATTGAQLFAARQLSAATGGAMAAALGGGAAYDAATGSLSPPAYVVLGGRYDNVGGALGALNTRVEGNSADIADLRVNGGGGGAGEIAALQAQLALLQGQIAAQQALLGPLQAELARLAAGNLGGGTAVGGQTAAGGVGAVASGADATAIGGTALAAGDGSTALGQGATAGGAGSLALGQGAQAAQSGAVAIGQGVATSRADQVAIGGGASTYTLAGLASPASLAAQSGQTYLVTTDASGNLATLDMAPVFGRIDALEDRADAADERWRVSGERFDRHADGVAMALALGGAQVLQAGQTFAVSGNLGHFDGRTALGFGAIGRANDAVSLNIGVGWGLRTGVVAGRAGLSIGW